MSVTKVFEDNPEYKQTRSCYLVDGVKPPGYKGDCKVKHIKLLAMWWQCTHEAEKLYGSVVKLSKHLFEIFFTRFQNLVK